MTQKVDATARVPVGRNSKRIPPFFQYAVAYAFFQYAVAFFQ